MPLYDGTRVAVLQQWRPQPDQVEIYPQFSRLRDYMFRDGWASRRLQQKKKKSNGRSREVECMVRSACGLLFMSLLAVVVCVVFLVLGSTEKVAAPSTTASPPESTKVYTWFQWSEWSTWSSCSVTCGTGSQTRYKVCNLTYTAAESTSLNKTCQESGFQEIDSANCSLQNCSTIREAPTIPGFKSHLLDEYGERYIYTCSNDTDSIQVGSSNVTCPVALYDNNTDRWSTFDAECIKVREDDQWFNQYGGSTFARFGYVTSVQHPLPYPNESSSYTWTLASPGSEITFQLLTLYTDALTGSCDGRSSVSFYCSCNGPVDSPNAGPFCGQWSTSSTFQCRSPCAIIRYQVFPRNDSAATGFHVVWDAT